MISAKINLWGTQIGALTQNDLHEIPRFSYAESFLESGIQLSPIMLPLSRQIYSFPALNPITFFGLPGIFADSLPDKYGTKVFERYLSEQGRNINDISAVERLCYIGNRGMGALEYVPDIGAISTNDKIDIDSLVKLASDILTDRTSLHAKSMEQMFYIGTSAGGARAKAVIAWNPETGDIRSGQIDAGQGYEYWIIKFDGVKNNKDKEKKQDAPEYTKIEYAYYLMAKAAGININECRLYEKNGYNHFMTKRFDRDNDGRKLHMLSLGGMAHYDFNTPGVNSYEQIAGLMNSLGLSNKDMVQLYRRMLFNDMAKNYDDHVKNFSFLMNRQGQWALAPAYDITYSYDTNSFWIARHQILINGKQDNITEDDYLIAAKSMNLPERKARDIIAEVRDAVNKWMNFAELAGVNEKTAETIQNSHKGCTIL